MGITWRPLWQQNPFLTTTANQFHRGKPVGGIQRYTNAGDKPSDELQGGGGGVGRYRQMCSHYLSIQKAQRQAFAALDPYCTHLSSFHRLTQFLPFLTHFGRPFTDTRNLCCFSLRRTPSYYLILSSYALRTRSTHSHQFSSGSMGAPPFDCTISRRI